jgi:retron-type reverse transcriptase
MSLILELVEHFGLGVSDLQRIIDSAPARYKVYEIPKRHGGSRIIAQPSSEIKALQRFILETKLSIFPIHAQAMAYVRGKNIYENAVTHVSSAAILKLDFQNFFPSIKVRDWEQFAKNHSTAKIDISDLRYYSKILFWGRTKKSITPSCLSIGAPTSPALSNILLYDLDVQLSEIAGQLGVRYTRYADDITVSAPGLESVLEFERFARGLVKGRKSPKLFFNESKRGVYLRGQRRLVTGLVITPVQTISIGRKRKRTISALIHRSTLNQLDLRQRGYLKGLLGFCIAHEPNFIGRLRVKYGSPTIDAALKFRIPKKSD